MTAGAGGLPKRCGIVQNVQKITPNPVNFDSDKLVLRANKPRPIRIRITTMKNHDMERRMRTEQEFQQLYDELNLVPSQKQPATQGQTETFELCTVLKDVEISYASSTEYVSDRFNTVQQRDLQVG